MNRLADIYRTYKECGGVVTTDSRAIKGGELFIALKGENFDGNEYALKALEAGAAYAVVNKDSAVAAQSGENPRLFHSRYCLFRFSAISSRVHLL